MTQAQWLQLRPERLNVTRLALAVWEFCGGWQPHLIPYAAAFYEVADVDLLVRQLQTIRKTIAAWQQAQADT